MPRKTDRNPEAGGARTPVKTRNAKKKRTSKSDDENFSPVEKKKKSKEKQIKEACFFKLKNPACNILKYLRNTEMGLPCKQYRKPLKDMVINYCRNFRLYKVESPFNRRVTFIVWHPTKPNVLAVTSHWGDILLYNYEKSIDSACMINGVGAGGSVQGMKFDPINPIQIYTVSMEGKFLVLNFETKKATQFLETNDINRWYVSLDVNSSNNMMVAGDTSGGLTVLTLQGEVIHNRLQLHKKPFKISHTEFSKRAPWLLCTSSIDSSIKLWDIRNLKSQKKGLVEPLQTIRHAKPINAAYFSLTDGCRLLTTDQFDKISIYRAPLWDLETVIHHPHRQFQHITPIKAYWHPLEDIVFVGRYPHAEFPGYHKDELRTIDFFDADTGDLLYQHYQNGFNGIASLNRFNITGDALASSYGNGFMIWKPNFRPLEKASKIHDALTRNEKGDKNSKNNFPDNDDNDDDDDDDDDDDIDFVAVFKEKGKERRRQKNETKKKKKV